MLAIFYAISLSGLGLLCLVIWKLGASLSDCPQSGRAARAGAMTVMAGFAMIGGALLTLIAAGLLFVLNDPTAPLFVALGLGMLMLGLGFSQSAATLQAIVSRAMEPARPAAPEPEKS